MRSTTPEILSAATTSRRSPAIGARKRNQLDRAALGLDFERIELLVVLDDLLRALGVALDEAAHRLIDRMLGQAAHLADEGTEPFDVFIEGLERMSAGLLHHWAPISRNGR